MRLDNNMSATLLGDTLYVLGIERDSSSSMFSLCLDNYSAGWTEVPFSRCPFSLCLANCMFSVDLLFQQMDYVTILNLTMGRWLRHLTTKGEPLTLTGSASVSMGMFCLYVQAGLIQDIFLRMPSSARYQMVRESKYLLQPIEWYRFNDHAGV